MTGSNEIAIGAVIAAMHMAALPVAAQQRVELPVRDRLLQGTPAAVYSVGREEGDEYELFAQVTAVGFDAEDNLYVLDSGNQRVVVFDDRGRHLRTIGRRGEGPGEFQLPMSMTVDEDGSVLVGDVARAALSYFSPSGEYRSVPLPAPLGRPMSGALASDRDGGVVIRTQLLNMDAMASGSPRVSPLHRLSGLEDGARVTQLFEFTLPAPNVRQVEGRTMVVAGQRAFEPQPLWTTLREGGVAVVHGTSYRIRIIDHDGRTQRIIERSIQARRVTAQDRERELERRAQLMQSGNAVRITAGPGGSNVAIGAAPRSGAGAPSLAELARTVEFADVIPVISQVRGDAFGRLWVQRAPARVGDEGAIDIITGTGRYVGTLPPQPLPGAISATGRAAFIVTDDLGVQRVVVRQLPREWM